MLSIVTYIPRLAVFMAGMATGAISRPRERGPADSEALALLKCSLAALERHLTEQHHATSERFEALQSRIAALAPQRDSSPSDRPPSTAGQRPAADNNRIGAIEKRLAEHAARLEQLPTADQIARMSDTRTAARQEAEARLAELEKRLEEQAARLLEVPTTAQITSAIEQVLSNTIRSLDERMAQQARSIEVLKTTVTETDNLLERVLESLEAIDPEGRSENTRNTAK